MQGSERLEKLSKAIANGDSDAAIKTLNEIANAGVGYETARALLRLLDDSSDEFDTMFGIIHIIERAPVRDVYKAIATELPARLAVAPSWMKRIVGRQLMASADQGRGYDAADFLRTFSSLGDKLGRSFIESVVAELVQQGKLERSRLPDPLCE